MIKVTRKSVYGQEVVLEIDNANSFSIENGNYIFYKTRKGFDAVASMPEKGVILVEVVEPATEITAEYTIKGSLVVNGSGITIANRPTTVSIAK